MRETRAISGSSRAIYALFSQSDVMMGDKVRKKSAIDNAQVKNLQITEQSLTLENKRFIAVYLQIL